ncbi:MAG: 3-deoxy-7-phosphoheptulonate synthase, partial [Clostridia bacterium]|nr:3-deoxy-7-phosphoheptulonate synthase [Clostridia bacterium]
IAKMFKGFMIESYLLDGNQKIGDNAEYGKSVTDACIGWETTEKLILDVADSVSKL